MTKIFLNLVKKKDIEVQAVYRIPPKRNSLRSTPRHIEIKLAKVKDKERIIKERQTVSYKGVNISLSANFLKETFQARRDWHKIFKVMKNKNLQPRLFYQADYHLKLKNK